ncbi:hypothetical protein P872_17555 [Rhodonellum psychrophilum GCM71 = DSM 17998]|uniref:Uncharacterized protein n=1 Tax=Rhodonellum psychrophilum GCM71 = DSM 17998 TaxID=1123057 RepID=U5BZ67_9BACT|nr:hypothetical protein P872_17555 [Rhodonellum psychrophilum GCM71 = DSM 17998]
MVHQLAFAAFNSGSKVSIHEYFFWNINQWFNKPKLVIFPQISVLAFLHNLISISRKSMYFCL